MSIISGTIVNKSRISLYSDKYHKTNIFKNGEMCGKLKNKQLRDLLIGEKNGG